MTQQWDNESKEALIAGDYDDFVICNQQDTNNLMQQAKAFVAQIKILINK